MYIIEYMSGYRGKGTQARRVMVTSSLFHRLRLDRYTYKCNTIHVYVYVYIYIYVCIYIYAHASFARLHD